MSFEFFSVDEKDTILELPEDDEDLDEVTYKSVEKNMKILKKINMVSSILLFLLGSFFLWDFLLYKEEYVKIPDNCFESGSCTFKVNTPSKRGDQYIYLEFQDFYQNYRDYQSSIDVRQLFGENLTKSEVEEHCWNFVTNKEMGKTENLKSNSLAENEVAIPCGLIAYSYPESKFLKSFPLNFLSSIFSKKYH